MNVTEISQLPDGMPILNFQARVTKTYAPQGGEGKYGHWSRMDMIVEDENEATIKVSWFDDQERSVFPNSHTDMMGEVIVINARKNGKNQIAGAKKGSYKGTAQIEVAGKHLTRSGRPTQPVGHNDPAWMGTLPTQPLGAPTTPFDNPAQGNAPTFQKAEAPKMNTTMQPKEKLTIPNVLALARFLAEELSASYRGCVVKDPGNGSMVESMVIDKTGVSVNMILMSIFKGELHATNQSIEELCGGPDPFDGPADGRPF